MTDVIPVGDSVHQTCTDCILYTSTASRQVSDEFWFACVRQIYSWRRVLKLQSVLRVIDLAGAVNASLQVKVLGAPGCARPDGSGYCSLAAMKSISIFQAGSANPEMYISVEAGR